MEKELTVWKFDGIKVNQQVSMVIFFKVDIFGWYETNFSLKPSRVPARCNGNTNFA